MPRGCPSCPGASKNRTYVILKDCESLRTLSKNQVGQKAQITLVDSSPINLGVNSIIEEIFMEQNFCSGACPGAPHPGHAKRYSRVSIKYQKRSSLRFLLQKIISGFHTGPKITSLYSLELREHVRYPQHLTNCHRTLSRAIRSEFSKISKTNFFRADSLYFCSLSATKSLILQQKKCF